MRPLHAIRGAVAALVVLAVASCVHGPVQTRTLDLECRDACEHHRDCVDAAYDTSLCRARCRDTFQGRTEQAAVCEHCLSEHACTEARSCAGECDGVFS